MLKIFRKFFIVRRVRRKRAKTKKSKLDFDLYKKKALELVVSRLEYFNATYNFKYNSVKIKNATSRWGSCSSKGNLNFNYRIVLIDSKLSDYIIVHELCHLGEFNHSEMFWELVEKTIPDYIHIREELKKIGLKMD